MTRSEVPEGHRDLLERPLFAHLATLRPDGSPQSSVMWFSWDGERIRFSHTRNRQKYRNLESDPRISLHVQDPDNPYRTLEVRGRVESMLADVDAAFYRTLQKRYDFVAPVYDADVRVIITIVPTSFVAVDGGLTEEETDQLTGLIQKQAANAPSSSEYIA
jgi:PPOX class probable F420-dependent enzyme